MDARVDGPQWDPGESLVANASAFRTPSGARPAAVSLPTATIRLLYALGDDDGTVPVFEWSA